MSPKKPGRSGGVMPAAMPQPPALIGACLYTNPNTRASSTWRSAAGQRCLQSFARRGTATDWRAVHVGGSQRHRMPRRCSRAHHEGRTPLRSLDARTRLDRRRDSKAKQHRTTCQDLAHRQEGLCIQQPPTDTTRRHRHLVDLRPRESAQPPPRPSTPV